MARVPAQQRLALGQRAQIIAFDEAAHRHRAQVDELDIGVRLQHRDRGGRQRERKARGPVEAAEKHHLGRIAEVRGFGCEEQRILPARDFLQRHQLAADQIATAFRCLPERRQCGGVGAQLGRALDAASGKAELRPGAEVGARGHAGSGMDGDT